MGLKVKLVKSLDGSSERQRQTVRGLGLWRFGQERVLKDTPSIRGMAFHVKHLVSMEETKDEAKLRKRMKPRKVRDESSLSRLEARQGVAGGLRRSVA